MKSSLFPNFFSSKKLKQYRYTTLQSMMNAKLSKQRFWHYYENGLIKSIRMINPQPICKCQVDFPLLWIKAYPGLS